MKREQLHRDVLGDRKLNSLLHPAQAFESPAAVLQDPDLTLNEKRAILASWALAACAIEAAPELRSVPSGRIVRFDEIMEALRTLDRKVNDAKHWRILRRKQILGRRRDDTSAGGTALQ